MWNLVKKKLPNNYDRCLVYKEDVALKCLGVAIFVDGKFLLDTTIINNRTLADELADIPIEGVTGWMNITFE